MQRRVFLLTSVTALLASALQTVTRSVTMRIRSIRPDGNAFAMACEVTDASRLLFVSGQVPETEDGVVPPDYKSQYRLAWANVERQLKEAGMTFDNLVKANIYLSKHAGEACPAKWEDEGDKTLKPGPEMVGRVHQALKG